jgi:hypothetical protein
MMKSIKIFLYSLCLGVKQHPWKTAGHVSSGFSILFSLIQCFFLSFPNQKSEGLCYIAWLFVISAFYGIARVRRPLSVRFTEISTTIEVIFGDLFQQEGLRAIPVNEFFDSEIGTPVSDKSLHGIFIKRCLGGHANVFNSAVVEQLRGEGVAVVENKKEGKNKSYKIGTSVEIKHTEGNSDIRYIAFALSKTDPGTCKAYCDVPIMWNALQGLWTKVRNCSGGSTINLPLVGSGQSGVNLSERDLLDLIIISAVNETRKNKITDKIRIVLRYDYFEKLDLRNLKKHWKG